MFYDLTQANADGRVSYHRISHPTTHPNCIATIATLYGMSPAPVERCRVLELGCATGGNIIPMAELLPGSQFVGVDVSSDEISRGRQLVSDLGLANVRLEAMDIKGIDESLGEFDYILCVGVFSWTPRDVQDKILAICRQNLAANGIACVNYNTFPGWHAQGVIRDALRFFALKNDDPAIRARQAKKALDFLFESIDTKDNPYGMLLKGLIESVRNQPEGFLYHAYVDVQNDPVYFHQFIQRASGQGLQYLGDSRAGLRWSQGFSQDVDSAMAGLTSDALEREQFADILVNRMRRDSLLCHEQTAPKEDLQPEGLEQLYVSANVRAAQPPIDLSSVLPATFRTAAGRSFNVGQRSLKAALMILGEAWPENLAMHNIQSRVHDRVGPAPEEELPSHLVELYRRGIVDLDASSAKFTSQIVDRPSTSRYAKFQATEGNAVTNLKHQTLEVNDIERQILQRLDASLTHAQLADALAEQVDRDELNVPQVERAVDYSELIRENLARLAQQAFLLSTEHPKT